MEQLFQKGIHLNILILQDSVNFNEYMLTLRPLADSL